VFHWLLDRWEVGDSPPGFTKKQAKSVAPVPNSQSLGNVLSFLDSEAPDVHEEGSRKSHSITLLSKSGCYC